MTANELLEKSLPGGDLFGKGLRDLARGVESTEALLVAIGRPRLTRLGSTFLAFTSSPKSGCTGGWPTRTPNELIRATMRSCAGS